MSSETLQGLATDLDRTPHDYMDAVRLLAAAHSTGPDSVEIFALRDDQEKVVRLLEVSDSFPDGAVRRVSSDGTTDRVVPVFALGPGAGFPYSSEVVQVTPREWEELRNGTLRLNRDWGSLVRAVRVDDAH